MQDFQVFFRLWTISVIDQIAQQDGHIRFDQAVQAKDRTPQNYRGHTRMAATAGHFLVSAKMSVGYNGYAHGSIVTGFCLGGNGQGFDGQDEPFNHKP